MNHFTCKIKDYIQPFERVLAVRELASITGITPLQDPVTGQFLVRTSVPITELTERLAYWETVNFAQENVVTIQAKREATVNVVRNGIDLNELASLLPFTLSIPLPNRRCLRYGTHGIHEYRGKFFPQLVRSLINISGTPKGGIIADPMSGSGTTVVEANLLGCIGIGMDMNPLSVFIGNTKCELLKADPTKLKAAYLKVRSTLLGPEERGEHQSTYFAALPLADQEYLRNWFAQEVIENLDDISSAINDISYRPAKNLMWVALSNIIRSVSWQKDDDLRVRKDIRMDIEIDPKKEFLEELARSIRAILAFLYQNGRIEGPSHRIMDGDARSSGTAWRNYLGKVDAVITSPPYATALPYLDTDRLSLCYLGLLSRPSHRNHDHLMIGNREVTEKLRISYIEKLAENKAVLPVSIYELIKKIETLNRGTNVGFRRRNLPALLAKYFLDMRDVLQNIHALLKPGGMAYLVVGNNHTIAGGERVDILTADLLTDIALSLNFNILNPISMEMLISRDIFKKNASDSEKILSFQKNHK